MQRYFYLTTLLAAASIAGAPTHAADAQLTNAALREYGARVSLSVGTGARKDPATGPEAAFDGNLHSRQVVSGAPYTFTIALPFRVMIDHLAFANSDYETEVAPKDLEITLDDGAPLRHTLELKRPVKRKAQWQEVPVGKEAQVIKVTVLSNFTVSDKVNWGGLGEIAVLTAENLAERFRIPGYDEKTATFVHAPQITTTVPPRVELPPRAVKGEHPSLLLTKSEVAELRDAVKKSERGKAPLETLINIANGAANDTPDFPDPKGPQAQLNDRGDILAKQHDQLSKNAGTLGMAYTLTGDAKYATRGGNSARLRGALRVSRTQRRQPQRYGQSHGAAPFRSDVADSATRSLRLSFVSGVLSERIKSSSKTV